MKKRTLYLVDASIYVFRAWYSMPDSLVDSEGRPVNAVYGYAYFLCQLLERVAPGYIAVAFDESLQGSFRNRIYPEYKSNRESAPDELRYQFAVCRKLTRALGISSYASRRYEADDLLGTLSHRLRKHDFNMVFVSGDKDLSQLVRQGDRFWNFAKDEMHAYRDCRQVFGVRPEQMVDLLALAGDAVDNIPGVPGIGHKTAVTLLQRFGSLDGIYAKLHRLPGSGLRGASRLQALLEQHEPQAQLSRQLAMIARDAPMKAGIRDVRYTGTTTRRVNQFCTRHGLGDRLRRRLLAMAGGY